MHACIFRNLRLFASLSVIAIVRLLEEEIRRKLLVLVAREVSLDDEIALEAEKAQLSIILA